MLFLKSFTIWILTHLWKMKEKNHRTNMISLLTLDVLFELDRCLSIQTYVNQVFSKLQ